MSSHYQPMKILVVDDHRDIRETLARYLVKNGMRASAAENAAQARKALKAAAVDLVLECEHRVRCSVGRRRIEQHLESSAIRRRATVSRAAVPSQ